MVIQIALLMIVGSFLVFGPIVWYVNWYRNSVRTRDSDEHGAQILCESCCPCTIDGFPWIPGREPLVRFTVYRTHLLVVFCRRLSIKYVRIPLDLIGEAKPSGLIPLRGYALFHESDQLPSPLVFMWRDRNAVDSLVTAVLHARTNIK